MFAENSGFTMAVAQQTLAQQGNEQERLAAENAQLREEQTEQGRTLEVVTRNREFVEQRTKQLTMAYNSNLSQISKCAALNKRVAQRVEVLKRGGLGWEEGFKLCGDAALHVEAVLTSKEAAIAQIKAQTDEQQQRLDAARNQLKEVQSRRAMVQHEYDGKKRLLDIGEALRKQALRSYDDVKTLIDAATTETRMLDRQFEQAKANDSDMDQRLRRLEDEKMAATRDVQRAKAENADLEAQIAENKKREAKLEELRQQFASVALTNKELQNGNGILQNKIVKVRDSLAEVQREIASTQSSLQARERTERFSRSTLIMYKKEIDDGLRDAKLSREQVEAQFNPREKEARLKELSERKATLEEMKERKKAALIAFKKVEEEDEAHAKRNAALASQIPEDEKKLDEEAAKRNDTIRRHEDDLKRWPTEMAALNDLAASNRQEIDKLQRELSGKSVLTLEALLDTWKGEEQSLRDDVSWLRERITQLKAVVPIENASESEAERPPAPVPVEQPKKPKAVAKQSRPAVPPPASTPPSRSPSPQLQPLTTSQQNATPPPKPAKAKLRSAAPISPPAAEGSLFVDTPLSQGNLEVPVPSTSSVASSSPPPVPAPPPPVVPQPTTAVASPGRAPAISMRTWPPRRNKPIAAPSHDTTHESATVLTNTAISVPPPTPPPPSPQPTPPPPVQRKEAAPKVAPQAAKNAAPATSAPPPPPPPKRKANEEPTASKPPTSKRKRAVANQKPTESAASSPSPPPRPPSKQTEKKKAPAKAPPKPKAPKPAPAPAAAPTPAAPVADAPPKRKRGRPKADKPAAAPPPPASLAATEQSDSSKVVDLSHAEGERDPFAFDG